MNNLEVIASEANAQITLRSADMPDGSQVRYMWAERPEGLGEDTGPLVPVLYKNGFNDNFETLDGKATVMRSYAEGGINAVMIDPVPAGKGRRLGSVRQQAEHTLDALVAIGLHEERLPAVGYCVGAQVVNKTVELATERGIDCFRDAPIVLLTPTGLNDKESPVNFFVRGLKESVAARLSPEPSLLAEDPMADNNTELAKAVLRHPFMTVRQYWTMTTGRIDLGALSEQVGSVGVVSLYNDHLLPGDNLTAVRDAIRGDATVPLPNVSAWMPYSTADAPDGHMLGVRDSSHVDPFRYPRVSESIAQFITRQTA